MTVYLDHAATTPLRAEARDAWLAAHDVVGNASSIHAGGQAARRVLEEARERLAAVVGCDAVEIVFTSGGTESVNLALKGLWWSREAGREAIVLPDGEHHASVDSVAWLEEAQGAHVRSVALDRLGRISRESFIAALRSGPEGHAAPAALATALVANNEVGTIQDAAMLAEAAASAGVPLHLDAVSAFGQVAVDFSAWRGGASGPRGLVALSLSGHKVGAPVGVGALVAARTAKISPLLHGGGQQRGLRSGTQDIAGAAAFAVAAELAEVERDAESRRLADLREALARGIREAVPPAEVLGDPVVRTPGNLHVLFPGAAGETLLFLLDQAGIAVSTGSACQAGIAEPSHVVLALGRSAREARSVLRFTLGRSSSAEDVAAVTAAIGPAYARASAAS